MIITYGLIFGNEILFRDMVFRLNALGLLGFLKNILD